MKGLSFFVFRRVVGIGPHVLRAHKSAPGAPRFLGVSRSGRSTVVDGDWRGLIQAALDKRGSPDHWLAVGRTQGRSGFRAVTGGGQEGKTRISEDPKPLGGPAPHNDYRRPMANGRRLAKHSHGSLVPVVDDGGGDRGRDN